MKWLAALPRRILLALMLLVSLTALVSVFAMRYTGEQHKRGLELWLRLQREVVQARSLQKQAAQQPTPDLTAAAKTALRSASGTYDSLARTPLTSVDATPVGGDLRLFEEAALGWLTLLETGQTDSAAAFDRQRLSPAYDTLQAALSNASGAYQIKTQTASLKTATGSTLLLGAAFSLLGLLFWRFDHTRRASERLAAEKAALRRSDERYESLLRNANDVVIIIDTEGTLAYASPAALKVLGHLPEALIGTGLWILLHPDDQPAARALLNEAEASPGNNVAGELRIQHNDGTYYPCEVVINNLRGDPYVAGIVLTAREIRERKASEERMARLAFRDPLTDLANRTYFMQRMRSVLKEADERGATVGLMFFDLDNFKVVNDSLGHDAGDNLLIGIAERLRFVLPEGSTAARLGGDEFTVLVEGITEAKELVTVAERFRSILHGPFSLSGHDVFTTASIGLALSTPGMQQPDTLLQRADLALYKAKFNGKNQWQLFDHAMEVQVKERLELETDLRRALERGEFRVFYQPVVDMRTGTTVELEALVRWEHPTRGLLAPVESLQAAEETGLILPLGVWVLEEACRQMMRWTQRLPEHQLVVSVNISGRQLQHPLLVEQIDDILRQTGLKPEHLKLEIREGSITHEPEGAVRTLHRLKSMGILLTLDDFGSGHNSLAALKRFPVDTLKIDPSFVSSLDEGPDAAIMQAIITMADTLNLAVTCEGVETKSHYDRLRSLGCHRAQGFYIAHPMPEDHVIDYVLAAPLAPPGDKPESDETDPQG